MRILLFFFLVLVACDPVEEVTEIKLDPDRIPEQLIPEPVDTVEMTTDIGVGPLVSIQTQLIQTNKHPYE